jgi:hypothetical protein
MNTASIVNTTSDNVSTVTTILPVPTTNIEIIPNPELLNTKQSLVYNKIYEIHDLYNKELLDNVITEADLTYIVESFSVTELNSENINNMILTIMSCYNG